jgi:hypothetical protein
MRMRPTAIGIDVVPTVMRSSALVTPGATNPSAMPSAIAAKIQRVR